MIKMCTMVSSFNSAVVKRVHRSNINKCSEASSRFSAHNSICVPQSKYNSRKTVILLFGTLDMWLSPFTQAPYWPWCRLHETAQLRYSVLLKPINRSVRKQQGFYSRFITKGNRKSKSNTGSLLPPICPSSAS